MSNIAWGITPYKSVTIPLEDYNADHYLTLVYQAMLNRGWHIDYFDHDGIMAYTNISLESYAEEVSVRIINNNAVIKSECIGVQALFTDYGKNQKNLDLLLDEIIYAEFHLKDNLQQTAQEMMDSVPENQFASITTPPMAGKEKLHGFFSVFVPQSKYFITPLLVIINSSIFIITTVVLAIAFTKASQAQVPVTNIDIENPFENILVFLGFSSRAQVLNGKVWLLVSNTFLHVSLLHLVGNMVTLVYVGSIIESKLGKWNYLFLYLFTGTIASMISVIWRDEQLSAGASGAIFGLFGILLALLSTNMYERNVRKALLISTLIFIVLNINPFREGIDHAAHFGGLFSGYIFGFIAYLSLTHKSTFIKKYGIGAVGIVLVFLFVLTGVKFTHQYDQEKFTQLKTQSEDISRNLHKYFYGYDEISRDERLYKIETEALPSIKKYRLIAADFKKLNLPKPKKREAEIRSKLIIEHSHFYDLLYHEFKEKNFVKYRTEINKSTEKINTLRYEWGTFEEN
ncbi:MAG: rhomboid family intramembrane serine protease [Sphingobacteriaceae bacterium]|nr:MAG: rhomboid family intramembrane serine protease [Sphingobacteriaceae bacterium]